MVQYYAIPGLTKFGPPIDRKVDANKVINAVCRHFNISPKEIAEKSRKRPIVEPRQIACYLLRVNSSLTFKEIGDIFNGRDHTTALHSIQVVKDRMSVDASFRNIVNEIEEGI